MYRVNLRGRFADLTSAMRGLPSRWQPLVVCLFSLACFFVIPAVNSLYAAFTFNGEVGTGWYDLQLVDDSDPSCIVFKNNWGEEGCPPVFPQSDDDVDLDGKT